MMIFKEGALLDEMTSAQKFVERLPHIEEQVNLIQDVRNLGDEVHLKNAWWERRHESQGSAGKHIACIPWEVWSMMLWLEPDIDHDKKKFYKWLDQHKEYQAVSR